MTTVDSSEIPEIRKFLQPPATDRRTSASRPPISVSIGIDSHSVHQSHVQGEVAKHFMWHGHNITIAAPGDIELATPNHWGSASSGSAAYYPLHLQIPGTNTLIAFQLFPPANETQHTSRHYHNLTTECFIGLAGESMLSCKNTAGRLTHQPVTVLPGTPHSLHVPACQKITVNLLVLHCRRRHMMFPSRADHIYLKNPHRPS